MKSKAEKILFILLLSCSSCSSVYRFYVDIQRPAAITLPVSAQNVLILNNTVSQPEDFGIDRTLNRQPVYTNFRISMDSMIWFAIDKVADVLDESDFFNEIAVYKKPVRADKDWLSKTVISPELQSEFYETEKFDALLAIDRLLFSVKNDVTVDQSGIRVLAPSSFIDLQVYGLITCSMYSSGNNTPLSTFTVSDSMFVKSTIWPDSIAYFKDIPERALYTLSRRIAERAARRFIPTWKREERVFYANFNPLMQEATNFAIKHKWSQAESLWAIELNKKKKPVDKAKIAINLAVANEMQDKFEQALFRAQQAKEYLKNAGKKNVSADIELTDEYIKALLMRIQYNRLLDLQWGKNE